ncbi:T-cell receptor-associated transmembrane adapter 1 [Pitangus sulphuratus]|nr:T-cell receptor-associated transmembrane adapter 1 [Pitangus sulphuratus]
MSWQIIRILAKQRDTPEMLGCHLCTLLFSATHEYQAKDFREYNGDYLHSENCNQNVWILSKHLESGVPQTAVSTVSYYVGKMHKDYEKNNPSYDDYPTEDYPVYGNLNQDTLENLSNDTLENFSLLPLWAIYHSVKGKRRKPRRKKDPSLEEDEKRSSNPAMRASEVSIYLNSEQLAAENTAKVEAIHDDPIRLMGLIHSAKGENI